MIIAIDGPAGSGKSTVAKLVAEKLGLHYLDTGAMYRAIAFRAMVSGISARDESGTARIAQRDKVTFGHDPGEALPSRVFIAGDDVTTVIRTPRVDEAVSAVASMPSVREAMVMQQREIAATDDIVVEGRDIGTVVFPDAEVKVFLTASASERARRRTAQQAASGHVVDPTGVLDALRRRDSLDSSRAVSPLEPADDAHQLDTTGLSIGEVVDRIVALAEEAGR